MEDPVYVDMLTGLVHDLKGIQDNPSHNDPGITRFKGFPLWDSPVLIIERSALGGL